MTEGGGGGGMGQGLMVPGAGGGGGGGGVASWLRPPFCADGPTSLPSRWSLRAHPRTHADTHMTAFTPRVPPVWIGALPPPLPGPIQTRTPSLRVTVTGTPRTATLPARARVARGRPGRRRVRVRRGSPPRSPPGAGLGRGCRSSSWCPSRALCHDTCAMTLTGDFDFGGGDCSGAQLCAPCAHWVRRGSCGLMWAQMDGVVWCDGLMWAQMDGVVWFDGVGLMSDG